MTSPPPAAPSTTARLNARAVMLAWSVPALLTCGQRLAYGALGSMPFPSQSLFLVILVPWYAWAAVTPFVSYITRRFPLRAPRRAGTFVAHLGACVLCEVAYSATYTAGAVLTENIPRVYTPLHYLWVTALGYVPTMTLVYGALVGILEWRAADARARVQEREAAELSAELAQAQLSALRMQLHPHFLFNALNTIAVLVGEEQRETAMQLLARLGGVLRAVVRGDPTREVTVRDEVALIGEYLDIEQVRFADRLRVEWDLEAAALDALVPVFVLQPLVENALRHGVGRAPLGGVLRIGARVEPDALVLWVYDDGPTGAAPNQGAGEEAGQGIGVSNTRARLARLYGDGASVALEPSATGGMTARVRIPGSYG